MVTGLRRGRGCPTRRGCYRGTGEMARCDQHVSAEFPGHHTACRVRGSPSAVPEAAHHADPVPAWRRRWLHGTGLRRLGASSSATRRGRLRRRGCGTLPATRAAGRGGAPHRRLLRPSLTEYMHVRRLAAVDAQTYWLSVKMPNDLLLVYGFDGTPTDLDVAIEDIRRRADGCGELRLRVRDGTALTYPGWASVDVDAGQFTVHHLDDNSWTGCLDAVRRLGDHHLDPRVCAWRLHIFPSIDGVPGAAGLGAVAVLQISHVLADGARSSAMAARLFGRPVDIAPVPTPWLRGVKLPWRTLLAARTYRQLVRETALGVVPAEANPRPTLRSNTGPSGVRSVRTLVVRHRDGLRGPTVTIGVMCAISAALSAHLRELGDDPSTLAAEVPMAKAAVREANNHFGNVGVGLYPEL